MSDKTASWRLDESGVWERHAVDEDGKPLDGSAERHDAAGRATGGAAIR